MEGSERGTLRRSGFSYHYQRFARLPGPGASHLDLARPPVLFLGGAFQSMASWNRFVRAFRPRRDVVLVDLPGSGSADLLPAAYGLDFLVGALEHLVRWLDLREVYLVAASYGSPIAYEFARRFPDRVSRLVLTGIARSIPDHVRGIVERSIDAASAGDREALVEMTITRLLCTDEAKAIVRRRLAARVLTAGIRQMDWHDLRKYVANSRRLLAEAPLDLTRAPAVESLVFTGEHDVFTTPGDCSEVARAIERAAYTTVSQADHLFHLQRFEATRELLSAFDEGTLLGTQGDWAPVEYPSEAPTRIPAVH